MSPPQLSRTEESERLLRDRDGAEQLGGIATDADLGETALQVSEDVLGVRGAHRPDPQPPRLPGLHGRPAAAHHPLHAAAHQR